MDEQGRLHVEIGKLKNRARAFTGAFVGMVSPVLLAIVLKNTSLKNIGKYQGTRMLESSIDLFEGIFPVLAAVTLPMGVMPFMCVMISEACAILPDSVFYLPERLLKASKIVVFLSNILLMFLSCGVLVFIHKNAWFSWLVVSACFIVAAIVIVLHICSLCWWCRRSDKNAGCTKDYHSELEHSLEFSAGITAMMFLVLGSVVLEGLLKRTQPQPPSPAPSEGATIKEPGTLLAATLFVSFLTSALAAFLMNVWTIPLVVLTGAHVRGLNITLATLAASVVFLIAWEGLHLAAWLTLLPPVILLLVLLKRCNCGDDDSTMQPQGKEKEKKKKEEEKELEAGPPPPGEQIQHEDEETKPAPLELTKVTFTGFLAVAVPGITSASPSIANKFCVFFAAATILLGILWRLLTHDSAPSPAVRKAASHSSFFAHAFFFFAGITFGVMAVNAPN